MNKTLYYFEHEEINACYDCPLLDPEQSYFCMLNDKLCDVDVEFVKPDWCQLKKEDKK